MARTMVTMAGKPSGIAETANETDVIKISSAGMPLAKPTPKMMPQATTATIPSVLPKRASLACNGVCSAFAQSRRCAIFPTSVSMPVAVTTAFPVPVRTLQPEKTILQRSAICAFSGRTASAFFSASADSPDKADSSHFNPEHSSKRASAGRISPLSKQRMSPGTRLAASMRFSCPSRMTFASGAAKFFNASSAFSALFSCITPMTALHMTIPKIRIGSK